MDRLSALPTEQRALVVAAVLRDGPNAERILTRAPDGAQLAEVARDLAALSSHERARRLAAEAARLFRPTPAGMDLIHPSWIDAALAGESSAVVYAARHGSGPVVAWLRRRLLGHLCAMPEGRPARPIQLTDVPKLSPEKLQRLLDWLGAREVATTLDAARAGRANRQTQLELLALAHRVADRAVLLRLAGASRFRGRGDLLRQIAQRLPIADGRPLLDLPCGPPDPALLDDVRAAVESSG